MATKTKAKKEATTTTAPVRAPAPTGLSDSPGRKEEEGFFIIDLTDLVPSPTNPRKHFNPEQLAELSESLKSKGMVQPIVVRPHATKGRYEIVAGERRYRAAQLAAMLEVPCIVRNLSDRETLEIQCIENEQRADVSPMERARAYRMLRDSGYSNKQIAEKVGTSEATVREIDALNRIPLPLIKALDAGKIGRSVAAVVARVPNESQRAEAAECVLLGCEPKDLGYRRQFPGAPLNLQRTQELIVDHYTRELKGAPFDDKDEKLLPSAGSCKKCPKRAGNNREEYPEGRADLCNDVACFRDKVEANKEALRVIARKKGINVATEEEIKDIYPHGMAIPSGNYVDTAHVCDLSESGCTWRNLLDQSKPSPGLEMLVFDWNGFPRYVANRSRLVRHLRDSGVLSKPEPKPKPEADDTKDAPSETKPPLIETMNLDTTITDEAQAVGVAAESIGKVIGQYFMGNFRELFGHMAAIACLDACESVIDGDLLVGELIESARGLYGPKLNKAIEKWAESASMPDLLRVQAMLAVQRCHELNLPYDTRELMAFATEVKETAE